MENSKWLTERLDKLDDKQDKMNDILIENTSSLKEHMRRTELLETELKPVKAHVQFVNSAAKIASIVLSGLLAAHTFKLI